MHPVELVGGQAPVGEVPEHRGTAAVRADQAQVGGTGGDRLLDRLLVAVALGGHDDHRLPVARAAAVKSSPATRSVRQPSARARSASVCAIGERPTMTRCGAGTTGSM